MTTTTKATTPPSYDDVQTAFARIRAEGGVCWDHEHPLRRFELAASASSIRFDAQRLASYRLAGQTPPLGYYDDVRDMLHAALEMIEAERRADHGDAAMCLAAPKSLALLAAKEAAR